MVERITKVPGSAPFVLGVVSVRGEIVPVLCLRRRLGLSALELDINSRLVVVEYGSRVVALLVDSAREFKNLDDNLVEEPPEELRSALVSGITSVDDRTVLFLSLCDVLEREEV
jgi:purine-binding chemotaxis protein CheW